MIGRHVGGLPQLGNDDGFDRPTLVPEAASRAAARGHLGPVVYASCGRRILARSSTKVFRSTSYSTSDSDLGFPSCSCRRPRYFGDGRAVAALAMGIRARSDPRQSLNARRCCRSWSRLGRCSDRSSALRSCGRGHPTVARPHHRGRKAERQARTRRRRCRRRARTGRGLSRSDP